MSNASREAVREARTLYPRAFVALTRRGGNVQWRAYYGRELAGQGWVAS